MGFKKLFKVRQPGNGSTFEDRVKAASKASVSKRFPTQDNSQVSSGKSPIKK